MMAHTVYNKCKSKELISTLNKVGYSISYTEYHKCRHRLAGYVYKSGLSTHMPLPAHINTKEFAMAAFHNFDHEDMSTTSGTKRNHDTVTVIFQNVGKDDMQVRKEKVSEFGPLPPYSDLVDKLDCQKLQTYIYNKATDKKAPLPSQFLATKNPQYEDDCRSSIISMARNFQAPSDYLIANNIPITELDSIPTWTGSHALTSTTYSLETCWIFTDITVSYHSS